MPNLNEINVSEDASEPEIWAAEREFELRHRQYQIFRFGALALAIRDMSKAMKAFNRAWYGDKDAN